MTCPDCPPFTRPICVLRGYTFTRTYQLANGFPDVLENPTIYALEQTFTQDLEFGPVVFTQQIAFDSSNITTGADGKQVIVADFTLSPTVTQSFPQYGIFGYVDLVTLSGTLQRRLATFEVEVQG